MLSQNSVTFTPVVLDTHRKQNGTNFVRIRLTKNRVNRYIKTNVMVHHNQVGKGGHLKDAALRIKVDEMIRKMEDITATIIPTVLDIMTADEIIRYIASYQEGPFRLDFFSFAEEVIAEKKSSAKKTYTCALKSFKGYVEKEQMDISEVSSTLMRHWEKALREKYGPNARAVSAYTSCIAHIHGQARLRYNNEECGQVKINNPFQYYKPSRQRQARHRSVDYTIIQKMIDIRGQLSGREKLGVDVFLISFGLMGMNAPDLYSCSPPTDEILHYYRQKTRDRRDDQAEMYVKIDERIAPIVKEYLSKRPEHAFDFNERYSTYQILGENVNEGLKQFAERIGFKEKITLYSTHHSWATIAYESGVDKGIINDGLCHIDEAMRVTDIYIRKNWSVVWNANKKVLDRLNWG